MDDYAQTIKAKTEEIISIGREHKIQAFLQPGDFFDSPNPGNEFVSEVASMWNGGNANDLLSKYRSGQLQPNEVLKAMNDHTPIIGVAGNHELFGNNINTIDKTAIGLLNKWGLMQFATKEKPYYFYTDDGLKIAVTGTHYHLDIDTPEHLDDYIVEEKLGDYHIHIVHGMLSDKGMGKFIRHTLVEEIKHTKADLTISGHDHIGFPLTCVDGKWFVNPGAIPRMKNNVKEISRRPKVLLIDITKENGMKLEEIYLKSAPKGELVLNRKKIEAKKQRDERLEDYKKALKEVGMKKSTDIVEIIRDLADSKNIPLYIKEDILNRVGNKKAEMSLDTDSLVTDANVEKIILINFQAHEYTELDFKDGFNLLVGESGQGKTSILRALDWVYENKPSGKGVIRRGSDYAKVIIHLSNGFVITRLIEKKTGGKNGYEIVDPKTGAIEFHNTKILSEVQKLLGFNQLIIDKDLQFNLNFMKQGTGWFLIGDNYPAPQKAKILGSIYGVQYADAVSREFVSEEGKLSDSIKKSHEELSKIDEKIGHYDYLKDIENAIKESEELLKQTNELEERKIRIQLVMEKRIKQQMILDENHAILQSLKHLTTLKTELVELKEQVMQSTQLEKLMKQYEQAKTKRDLSVETIERTKDLDRARKGLLLTQESLNRKNAIQIQLERRESLTNRIKEEEQVLEATEELSLLSTQWKDMQHLIANREKIVHKLERAKELEIKRGKSQNSLDAINDTLKYTKDIEEAKTIWRNTKDILSKQTAIEKTFQTHNRYKAMVQSEENLERVQVSIIQDQVEHYKKLLEEQGTCPTCFGTIDSNTAKRIANKYTA